MIDFSSGIATFLTSTLPFSNSLKFKTSFLNIGTLNNKLDFVHEYVSANDVLFFALNETWLDPRSHDSSIKSNTRSVLHQNRTGRLGGGVLIF